MTRIPLDVTKSVSNAVAVTPADGVDIPVTRGLYIGGAGDVAVKMLDGGTVTFKGVLAGSLFDIQVTQVALTGTTGTNILALY